jgi:glycosyltransferase involved in cell wall biosynthesis
MLCKKPVIGKKSGATTELIKDGETGLLYDSVNELAEKIAVLYENEEMRNHLALKGNQYAVTNFSSGKSINMLNAVIKNLV